MEKHIVILGGGISGLSLAWFAKKAIGPDGKVTVIEKSSRLGGWIKTVQQDGFLFEQGPHSCRTQGVGLETLRLIQELHMEDQVLPGSDAAHRRYLYHQKQLKPLPQGILSFLSSPWMWNLIPPLMTEWLKPKRITDDESIHDFMVRRFNPWVADVLADAMVTGIFAGDPRKLSLKACFPIVDQWEQQAGSVLKGAFKKKAKQKLTDPFLQTMQKRSIFTLRHGMESLIHTLQQKLQADILLSTETKALKIDPDHIDVVLPGRTIHADHVFSTLPTFALEPLLSPLDPSIGLLLKQWTYSSVAVLNFGYRKASLPFFPGFGYLVPQIENEKVLGILWDSHAFPEQNTHPHELRMTVMIGGTRMENFQSYSEEDFLSMALEAVSRHLHLQQKPDSIAFQKADHAIPQYTLGHQERVKNLEHSLQKLSPRLTLAGSSFYGVAVNDCISHARKLIEKMDSVD